MTLFFFFAYLLPLMESKSANHPNSSNHHPVIQTHPIIHTHPIIRTHPIIKIHIKTSQQKHNNNNININMNNVNNEINDITFSKEPEETIENENDINSKHIIISSTNIYTLSS
eukprot:5919_1